MKRSGQRSFGFTIVELLIVIVVVAVLAAITVVAYNGIQIRANETVVSNNLASFHKKVALYQSEYGNYPKDLTELGTIRMPFTRSAYYITDLEGNLTYCASAGGADYFFIARAATGKRFYIGSSGAPREYTGAYGTPAAMCGSLGLAYNYGAWGYEPNVAGWGSPGWKVWTSA